MIVLSRFPAGIPIIGASFWHWETSWGIPFVKVNKPTATAKLFEMAKAEKASQSKKEEDNTRFSALFKQLDVNKDGRIEASELSEALKKLKLSSDKDASRHAQV